MNLLINTLCNLKCNYCFHGKDYVKRKDIKTEMSLKDIDKIIKWFNMPQEPINILGGEPTQHSQFIKILDLLDNYKYQQKFIMTNGIVNFDQFKRMVDSKFIFLINITTGLTTKQKEVLENNLKYIPYYFQVSINLHENDQNIDYELYLISKYNIQLVNINLPAPGRAFSNKFNLDFSYNWGTYMYEVIKRIHSINPQIKYGTECSIPGCYSNKEIYDILVKNIKRFRTTKCTGNFDIYPDLHSHWCPALEDVEELKIDNIFKYKDFMHLRADLNHKYAKYHRSLGVQCKAKENDCYNIECNGPCAAYNLALKKQRDGQILPMEIIYNEPLGRTS